MTNRILIPGRKEYIDSLRALAIIFVMLGHFSKGAYTEFFVFSSPIKMPLFFIISGFLFNSRDGNCRLFIKNMFWKLIIPWLFLGLLPVLISLSFTGFEYSLDYIVDMLTGKRYWFMPCLIWGECLFFFFLKYIGDEKNILIVSCVAMAIGLITYQNEISILATISRILAVQPFFAIGLIIRRNEKLLDGISLRKGVVLLLIYCMIGIVSLYFYPNENLDVHHNYYYNFVISFSMILIGCISLFIISSKLKNYPKLLLFIGQNTFVLYMWHGKVSQILDFLMHNLHIYGHHILLIALLKTVWACFVCGLLSFLISNYCPVLIGKKKIF